MTTNRDRQRAAARARLEREMADRAEQSRLRRRRNTMISAGAGGLVVLLGVAWLVVALTNGGDKKTEAGADPSASATPTSCTWLPLVDPSVSPKPEIPKEVQDVGTPPTTGEARTGTQLMTLNTSIGAIKIDVDTAHAPCAAESFTYLAGKKFFDNSTCHRLVTQSIYVLQCGDPSATGLGGPMYRYAEENLPTGRRPAYPEGTVAMAKTQDPNSTGSQFFIVYKDIESLQADYTILGKVTEGLDLVKKLAEGGVIPDPAASGDPAAAGDGEPKTEVRIKSLTMSPATP